MGWTKGEEILRRGEETMRLSERGLRGISGSRKLRDDPGDPVDFQEQPADLQEVLLPDRFRRPLRDHDFVPGLDLGRVLTERGDLPPGGRPAPPDPRLRKRLHPAVRLPQTDGVPVRLYRRAPP